MRKRTINNPPGEATRHRCAIDLLDVLQGLTPFDPSVLLGDDLVVSSVEAADIAPNASGAGLVGLADLDMEKCSPFSYKAGFLPGNLRYVLICASFSTYGAVAAAVAVDGGAGPEEGSVVLQVPSGSPSSAAEMMPEFVSHWLAEQTPAAATAWALLLMAELRMHLRAFSCGDMPVVHSCGSHVALLMLVAHAEGFVTDMYDGNAEPEMVEARRLFEMAGGEETVAGSLETFFDLLVGDGTLFALLAAPYAVWDWTVESNPLFHPVNWFKTFQEADNPWLPS